MRLSVRIGLALLVVASMGVVVSSSGFTSTEADRSVSVTIVEDEDAYVGLIENKPIEVGPTDVRSSRGGEPAVVQTRYENASTVLNQFTVNVTVTAEVVDDPEGNPDVEFSLNQSESSDAEKKGDATAEVAPGGKAVYDAKVTCDANSFGTDDDGQTITVEYDAEGDGVSATLTREIEVTCSNQKSSQRPS